MKNLLILILLLGNLTGAGYYLFDTGRLQITDDDRLDVSGLVQDLSVLTAAVSPATPAAAAMPEPAALTYTLTEDDGMNGPATVHVTQIGQRALARKGPEPDARVALASDPARGMRSSVIYGFGPPVPKPVIVGPDSLAVGDLVAFQSADSPSTVEMVRYELERGDRDRELLGHQARHSVLTVELKISRTDDYGTHKMHATGRADLWTIAELPFSWIPYTGSDRWPMSAVPLSNRDAKVASFLLNHFAAELEKLGLLARAEVTNEYVNGLKSTNQREVVLADLNTDIADAKLEFPPLAALSPARVEALEAATVLPMAGCMEGEPDASFALDSEFADGARFAGSGNGRLIDTMEDEGTRRFMLALRAGSPENGEMACVVAVVRDLPELTAGTYPLLSNRQGIEAAGTPSALAVVVRMMGRTRISTILESGALTLHDEGGMRATLKGEGFSVTLPRKESPTLHDGATVDFVFGVEGV